MINKLMNNIEIDIDDDYDYDYHDGFYIIRSEMIKSLTKKIKKTIN